MRTPKIFVGSARTASLRPRPQPPRAATDAPADCSKSGMWECADIQSAGMWDTLQEGPSCVMLHPPRLAAEPQEKLEKAYLQVRHVPRPLVPPAHRSHPPPPA